MSRSSDLEGLLSLLQEADSPFDKLHQLALAWRSVRSLSPQERRDLARHAGFDGAEELIERLATRRGGLAPALLLQAIERARNADPALLREIFQGLRDPGSRLELLAEGARAAAGAVAASAPAPEQPPAPAGGAELPPAAVPETGTPAAVEPAVTEAPAMPEIAAAGPPGQDGEAEPPEETVPPVEPEPATAPDPNEDRSGGERSEAPPAPAPPEPTAAPAPVRGAAQALPVSERPAGHPAGAASATARTVSRRSGALEQLLEQLQAAPTVSERLRIVREAALPPTAGREDLRRLLAAFPWSWARRRIFCRLAERGLLDGLGSPGELLDGLSPADRAWCLTALARRRSPGQIDDLLRLTDSPALGRRLTRLAAGRSRR